MNTPVAFISNLAGGDLLIILVILLLLFGAKKLPELAKGMGQAVKEFNKAKDEFEREITKPANEVTIQQPKQVLPQAAPGPVVDPAAPSEVRPS